MEVVLGKGASIGLNGLKALGATKSGAAFIKQIENLASVAKKTIAETKVPTKVSVEVLADAAGGTTPIINVEKKTIGEIVQNMEARAKEVLSGASKVVDDANKSIKSLNIPQGFSEKSFKKFARAARQLSKAADLPPGELVVQGSRVSGTAKTSAKYVSDIDVALRVDEKTFFEFAQARIESVRPETRLHETLLRAARKGKLSKFDISPEFNKLLKQYLAPNSPYDIDFSIIKVGSKYDTGPFIQMGEIK